MADPVGLVSLGVGGIGRLVKHRAAVRARERVIAQLAEEADLAYAALLLAQQTSDHGPLYEEVLAPPLGETVAFLEHVNSRSRTGRVKKSFLCPEADARTAQRMINALRAVPSEVELRSIAQAVRASQDQLERVSLHEDNMILATDRMSRQLLRVQYLLYSCFFLCGEASVTLQLLK